MSHIGSVYATNTNERVSKREKEKIRTGRPRYYHVLQGRQWNIPTCVGKTLRLSHAQPERQEHPHVRGEDSFIQCRHKLARRNIPTCVGKTLKMLSKIKHLTFSKVPFSLTFKSCPKISVFLFSLLFVFQRASFHPTSVVWNVTLIPHKKVPVKNSTMKT